MTAELHRGSRWAICWACENESRPCIAVEFENNPFAGAPEFCLQCVVVAMEEATGWDLQGWLANNLNLSDAEVRFRDDDAPLRQLGRRSKRPKGVRS